MKNKWRNYALKDGKISESYLRQHKDRDGTWKAAETGYCDSYVKSRKKQEKIRIENESIREKNFIETHQQGQQGIQVPVERRPTIEETNFIKQERKEIMKKATAKHKLHEAKESKAYEKKEDKREVKKEKKKK